MDFSDFLNKYEPYKRVTANLDKTPISVAGVVESAQSQLIYALTKSNKQPSVVVTYSDMEARALYNDLNFYTDNAVYFPSKEYVFYNIDTTDHENVYKRLATLYEIKNNNECIMVASLDALLQYTIDKKYFTDGITLSVGSCAEIGELTEKLILLGYSREDMVENAGQFSVRGGILDVFLPNEENPFRIEFFDNETDSIRSFDVTTQRSMDKLDNIRIIPATESVMEDITREKIINDIKKLIKNEKAKKSPNADFINALNIDLDNFTERRYFPAIDKYISKLYDGKITSALEYLTSGGLVFIIDPKRIAERGKTFETECAETAAELAGKGIIKNAKERFFISYADFINIAKDRRVISIDTLSHSKTDFDYKYLETFTTKTTISFHG